VRRSGDTTCGTNGSIGLDWFGDFEKLDLYLRMLRTWDPTHPVWVGTYRYLYCEHYPTSPGVVAWYDYHWARGMPWNFAMLKFYRDIAKKRNSAMGKWLLIHDYNRNLYTLNTSIAFGVKTVIWFIGGPYAAREPDLSKRWHEDMHLVRIGRHMQALYPLIGEMGPAVEVYSTPTRRTADNRDKPLDVPEKLTPFPEDHWLKVKQGEVVCGFFKLPDKSQVVYVANHNAYAWQGVVMALKQDKGKPRVVSLFDREKGGWAEPARVETINFAIPPADAAVLRFVDVSPEEARKAATAPEKPPAGWSPAGHFERIAKLLRERDGLAAGQQPYAVYSTPTLRTAENRDKPPGLPQSTEAFPDDFWLEVKQGEMLCGLFKLADGSDVACFSNHNGCAWQGGLIVPKQEKENPTMIWELDQSAGQWAELGTWGDVNFPLKPAGSAVFRFKRVPAK